MAANRGEIAIRIFRAATGLDIRTVAIYSKEDMKSMHRYKADEAYLVGKEASPVGAYLGYEEIVGSSVLNKFGDKTLARQLAVDTGVPVVGTPGECNTLEEVRAFVEGGDDPVGYPSSAVEALSAGDAAVFVERYVDSPRHVEVQILSDGESTVHLYDRDCSVQRRFQKVVEIAPSVGLPDDLRAALLADAVRLTSAAGYRCAGTVEFLVDPATWKHYFIEVNPRIQVEHTVTEVVTGVDLVQSQIMVTAGETLAEIGLADQDDVQVRGYAIQSRVTTEDPEADFRPDVGRLQVTGSALTYEGAIVKLSRALRETRIRGVKTNIGFTLNVLKHPDFRAGAATTSFIGDNPELFQFKAGGDRASKLLEYLAELAMLFRGANGVGYTSYPDNAVFKFCDVAVKSGMDVFRVFDSLNYVENLRLGIDAVGAAGALKAKGIHVLAIKDMAGLLTPAAASTLVHALRLEFPDLPIHVHTHDTAGTGVAAMLAAAKNGADAVDVAVDSMSGLTSQPSMGAVVASLKGSYLDTGVDLKELAPLIDYWESTRVSYAAFESGQKSGSAEVYDHEIPGGQYTNMLFQATQMGLSEKWPQVKAAYADANELLGDIVKVTPSSKTCGDLAQFMVTNGLTKADVRDRSESLNFPSSVVEFFQGALGIPYGGFPEPLRTHVLAGAGKTDETFAGRPGAQLPAVDLEKVRAELEEKHGVAVDDRQLMSAVMYPQVFDDFMATTREFGDLSNLPTRAFVEPLDVGEELELSLGQGVTVNVKLTGMGDLDEKKGTRECFFEVNGFPRSVTRVDTSASADVVVRPKASPGDLGSVGAPMPGVVVVKVAPGAAVAVGEPLVVLSAMKMETVVSSAVAGVVVHRRRPFPTIVRGAKVAAEGPSPWPTASRRAPARAEVNIKSPPAAPPSGVRASGALEAARARRRKMRHMEASAWTIAPDKSTWVQNWDAALCVALVYTAIVTPADVAFVHDRSRVIHFWRALSSTCASR
ncbi:pyruvate carboxylase [Aureococcus anophagefferens]|nr:pyruvate carboxylase [Aureococcus anophagefferens]